MDTLDNLQSHATQILDCYANPKIVDELQWQCSKTQVQETSPALSEGDMVFENAVLFLRDALISREFTDAVKSGDSGRALLVLKVWALSFRGNGHTKYAYEMLHLIHNVTHVWPKKLW